MAVGTTTHPVEAREVRVSLRRVALAVEMDEAPSPSEVGLLSARTVVFDVDAVVDAIDETGGE